VLASDYAYSGHEASALVRAYATTMARLIRPREANRFTLLARGRVTGLVLARDEWEWRTYEHAYAPTGEPWNTFKAAARRYWEITGTLADRRCFRPRLDA
jgi:hypothetical protein